MAPNCSKKLPMASTSSKWIRLAPIGFKWLCILLFFCTLVLLFSCTLLLLYTCTLVLVSLCICVLLYYCTHVPFKSSFSPEVYCKCHGLHCRMFHSLLIRRHSQNGSPSRPLLLGCSVKAECPHKV